MHQFILILAAVSGGIVLGDVFSSFIQAAFKRLHGAAEAQATAASLELHHLGADVVLELHKAETEGTVAAGTVQKVVDAHVKQIEAVTATL